MVSAETKMVGTFCLMYAIEHKKDVKSGNNVGTPHSLHVPGTPQCNEM